MPEKLDKKLLNLLKLHKQRYPLMEACDVYKMLYQAAMGGKHIIDHPKAKDFFVDEYERIVESNIELFENISPEQDIFRINLAAVKLNDLDPEEVWMAIFNSAMDFEMSLDNLICWWSLFTGFVEKELICFPLEKVREFGSRMKKDQYPLFHHSESYRE
ncbi:hypothetical protein JXI42_09160, partial [bacterium]|nr:hypothetical protein [bacterium]